MRSVSFRWPAEATWSTDPFGRRITYLRFGDQPARRDLPVVASLNAADAAVDIQACPSRENPGRKWQFKAVGAKAGIDAEVKSGPGRDWRRSDDRRWRRRRGNQRPWASTGPLRTPCLR